MTFIDETQIERVARFGILPAGSKADTQEGLIEKGIAAAVEITERLENEVARIKRDGGFTRKGLSIRKAELARESLQNLSVWEGDLKNKRGVLEKLRGELKVKAVTGDQRAHQVLLAEIRAEVRKVHDVERIALLHKAVEEGDTIIFEAIDSWPETLGPLVPPEVLENARERWAEKLDPALAQKVRTLADLVDQYERTLATARRSIEKLGGIERDPIVMLDAKGDAA